MSELTPRLGLPLLMASQAQKHVTHNEALLRIDQIAQLALVALEASDPPADPAEGQVWALGPAPTGAWAGQGGRLAVRFDGGWRFVVPVAGWQATHGNGLRVWNGAAWVVPDVPPLQNLPAVGVNATADATNRLTVAALATLLTHQGAGHQLKINKSGPGDTASLLFQTGFSGRAEMGTAGGDDFTVKVSADGAGWHTAISASAATGAVTLPAGLAVGGQLTLPSASVTRAALVEGTALSVIGRSAASAGAVADIAAGAEHQVLRRSGATLGFGPVALNQAGAVSGALPLANGGTGAETAAAARTNLGLGSAATATLTTSATDTTAGRVLRTGDAGVLGAVPVLSGATNLRDRNLRGGSYGYGSASIHDGPDGSASWARALHVVELPPTVTGGIVRRAFFDIRSTSGGSNRVWMGANQANDAIVWREMFHQGSLLGNVAQSGGIPTGAVFQTGATGHGRFRREASGELSCRHVLTTATDGPVTWTFPSAFVEAPVVVATAVAPGAVTVTLDAAPDTGSVTLSAWSLATGLRLAVPVHLRADGRWSTMS
jgi:hypothetical protein